MTSIAIPNVTKEQENMIEYIENYYAIHNRSALLGLLIAKEYHKIIDHEKKLRIKYSDMIK